MNIENLITLRFEERNEKFSIIIETIKRSQSSKQMLFSGNTVKLGYDALVSELKGSAETILMSFSDILVGITNLNATKNFPELAQSILSKRKTEIESIYSSLTSRIFSALANKEGLQPYFSLALVFEQQSKELDISVRKLINEYEKSLGKTLLERVKNQFLNRPLVVIFLVTVSAITTIMGFLTLIGMLSKC